MIWFTITLLIIVVLVINDNFKKLTRGFTDIEMRIADIESRLKMYSTKSG